MKEIEMFYETIKDVKYGWYDKNKELHTSIKNANFGKDYRMQDYYNILKNKYAICWEMCELERAFFKKTNYSYKVVFAYLTKNHKYPCHTFLIFEYQHNYYWFEASWERMKGIRKYPSLDSLFADVKNNFSDFVGSNNYDKDLITFNSYRKPFNNITCNLFYYHCMFFSKKIK